MNDHSTRPDRRSAAIAIVLIAIGAIFLLGELFNFRVGSGFWPIFILVPGLALLYTAFNGATANAGTASGGAVLTTLALIFFFQSSTGNWESWAYIWALLPLSVGIAQIAAGTRNEDEGLIATGQNTTRVFGIIFLAGLVFFELIIFDRGGFGGYLLPIALIVIGAFMLWLNYRRNGTMPFGDMFQGMSRPPPTPPTAPTPPTPPAVTPTAATPPTAARSAAAPPATSTDANFPEDELPHEPAPDDAPFPTDEHSPEPPKPKPRRRSSTPRSRKSTTTGDGSQGES